MTTTSNSTTNTQTDLQPVSDEERRQIELIVDSQIRIITGAYNQASAYTNLIIIAGYAGFFALWQMTKDYLGRKQTLFSALLMLFSVLIFMLFEVYKAHYSSRVLRDYQNAVQNREETTTLPELVEKMKGFEQVEQRAALRFVTLWHATFWATTITGVGAGLILGVAFVHRLLQ